ncbi:hypothetical protein M2132_000705 [Dysgonomonas sp. PH5-45]|uniref:DKNYY domain-containing protein n=1 Tax=unclassified Dysgonomonas TaxID=2630389 RepID=UPI0024755F45|nr:MULTISPECIES: DKNYY domain-containing protein [unclassified Dysgonomonas]MDH6354377.1 hypothetical protein [Dysgonomonas sp. PH5-45]MDH6387277.1 hypothetical protein [Dysgonomonas sp. PH5-37]
MRTKYLIIIFIGFTLFTIGCADGLLAQDFIFPRFDTHPPFRKMKCGLWINAAGDIAYKTIGCGEGHEKEYLTADSSSIIVPEYEIIDYYVTWCYNVRDSVTDNMTESDIMSELKNVVDTTSLKILSPSFFIDKNYVYVYVDMVCGGHISVWRDIDRKTFKVFKSNPDFACDKHSCFVMGRELNDYGLEIHRLDYE